MRLKLILQAQQLDIGQVQVHHNCHPCEDRDLII